MNFKFFILFIIYTGVYAGGAFWIEFWCMTGATILGLALGVHFPILGAIVNSSVSVLCSHIAARRERYSHNEHERHSHNENETMIIHPQNSSFSVIVQWPNATVSIAIDANRQVLTINSTPLPSLVSPSISTSQSISTTNNATGNATSGTAASNLLTTNTPVAKSNAGRSTFQFAKTKKHKIAKRSAAEEIELVDLGKRRREMEQALDTFYQCHETQNFRICITPELLRQWEDSLESHLCTTEGAHHCLSKGLFLTCVFGEYRLMRSCAESRECIQISEAEIECI